MKEGYLNNAQELLSQGRVLDCLDILNNNITDEDIRTQVLQLEIRYNSLRRRINAGTIDSEDAHLEENRISNSILFIITNMARGGTAPPPVQQKSSSKKIDIKWIVIGLMAIAILALVYLVCGVGNVSSQGDVDPCLAIICQNGGTCTDGRCACPPGYAGRYCQDKVAAAGSFQVTDVRLVSNPSESSGPCPAKIGFRGIITTDKAGTVTYRFIRSDGVKGQTQSLKFNQAASKRVENSWKLGASGRNYMDQWQAIEILSPNKMISNRAIFSLKCPNDQVPEGFRVIEATFRANPAEFKGSCPKVIEFSGRISTIGGSGRVSYRIIRSDGAKGPVETLNFTEPGSKTVKSTWRLGARGREYENYWEQILILEPTEMKSNQAKFTLICTRN